MPQDIGTHQLAWARPMLVRVLDHEGKPLAKAGVHVRSSRTGSWRWEGATDAKGLVSFPRTTNEDLILHGSLGHRSLRPHAVRIGAGTKPVKQTLRLVPYVQLRGTLEWVGEGAAPWAGIESPVHVSARRFENGVQKGSLRGQTFGQGSGGFAIERAVHGTLALRIRVAMKGRTESRLVKIYVPASALKTGRHDIGTIRVGPGLGDD